MPFCTSRSPLRAVPEAGWLPWPDCSSCHLLTVTFLLLAVLTHHTQSPASEGQGKAIHLHWSPGLPAEADDPTCPHVPWAGSLPCQREEGARPGVHLPTRLRPAQAQAQSLPLLQNLGCARGAAPDTGGSLCLPSTVLAILCWLPQLPLPQLEEPETDQSVEGDGWWPSCWVAGAAGAPCTQGHHSCWHLPQPLSRRVP